jgi:hypothetical protein
VSDDAADGTVPRYFCENASRSCFEPMFACRSLNCANCVTNVVPSIGWVGSWFFSWATRSCRNVFWLANEFVPLAEATDELVDEAAVVEAVVGKSVPIDAMSIVFRSELNYACPTVLRPNRVAGRRVRPAVPSYFCPG